MLYNQALVLARRLKSTIFEARLLARLTETQLSTNNIAAANRSIEEGMRLKTTTAWQPALYTVAAQAALKKGDLGSAKTFIDRALEIGSAHSAPLLRDSERTAYEVYKARGDERNALRHLEAFKRLDDQTRTVAASASTALLAAQFDFANQRTSIAQLKTNEIRSDAMIARSQRTILIILLAGSGLVTTLLLIGYLSIRRSRNRERAANEELSGTNAELEEALAARTRFLATTSHEIRTPLNGILGMTQVLLADRGLEPSTRSKIELVHGAGETMRALVDDILDIAKITTGELVLHPAEMDLARLLRDTARVWEGQAQAKGIAIHLELGGSPGRIVQDEVRLRQIVFNLVANAVKFTDRGEVRMVAEAVPATGGPATEGQTTDGQGTDRQATDRQATDRRGERLRIRISDTGIGIPADKLEEIFESFRQVDSGTTRRHGGTGLGLSICRSLAQAMGGTIGVESMLGVGATFTIDLPLVRGAEQAAAGGRAAPGTLRAARLLLVEANPLNQSILRAVLTPKVARFAAAGGVEEAIAAVSDGEVDLLLIDAAATGMDAAAAGAIAAPLLASGGRAVLLWPSPDPATAEAAARAGFTRLIATPVAAPDLVAALVTLYVPAGTPEEIAA